MASQNHKKYCKDNISLVENYQLALKDDFKGWDLHHRLELTLDGEFAHTSDELKRMDMYYNRPYFELIFLPRSVHHQLHGQKCSQTPNQRKAVIGNKSFIGHKHTDEWKKMMSEKLKGRVRSEETRKKMSEVKKGKAPKYTEEGLQRKREATIKYNKTRIISEETRRKQSESHKGQIPWNKGLKMNKENI